MKNYTFDYEYVQVDSNGNRWYYSDSVAFEAESYIQAWEIATKSILETLKAIGNTELWKIEVYE